MATAESSKFADIEYSTWTASYFRIWKSSAGISAPPLALLVVMFPKTYFTPHSRISGCRWVTTPSWLSQSLRPFLHSYCCYCSVSRVQLFVTAWTAAWQASLSFTISQSLLKLMAIESVMPSNHLVLCRPRLLLPSTFPSIRVFSNELAVRIGWPKDWSFSIHPSSEYSMLISFRMDWLDLLAVQGTLKSLLQHYSSQNLLHSSSLCSYLLYLISSVSVRSLLFLSFIMPILAWNAFDIANFLKEISSLS